MKHPLLPATALVALVILVCEGFFGIFTRLCDPSRSPSHYSHYVAEKNILIADVCQMPSNSSKSLRVMAKVQAITDSNGDLCRCHGKIQLYIQKPADIQHGDRLIVRAVLNRPTSADNPHQFDYRQYLARRGILYSCYVSSHTYTILGHNDKGLMTRITTLRQRMADIIHTSRLTPSQQGIAEALFLGWDDDLQEETEENFQRAGITHLLCVSGLHVGIVALLVGYCLSFLSNKRRTRIIKGCIQIAVIWFFVALTGMAPGTMRAGLMFSLVVIGQMFFQRPPTLNAIAASALILLLCRPLLLFDVSFQLSYSAVLGIVIFVPRLNELLPIPSWKKRWTVPIKWILAKGRTLMCVSIAGQICTAPFTLFYFHQFPLYFLVANMIVVPFAAILLGSVLVMVALAWWPWAFKAVGAILSVELSATERITSIISSWPYSMIKEIYFDGFMLCLLLAIVAAIGFILFRRRWSIAVTLALAIILTAYSRHIESRCASQRHFDVYNVGNRTAIEFFAGHESYLLCDSNTAKLPEKIDFQTSGNLQYRKAKRRHILRIDTTFCDNNLFVSGHFVGFDGKSMRIIDRSNYRQTAINKPHLEYILLRESPYITISELRKQYDFDTVIIASQNSQRRRSAWKAECDSLNIYTKE